MLRCLLVSFCLVSVSLLFGCEKEPERIQIVEELCGKCHITDVVYLRKRPKAEWDRVVYGMKVRGLKISEKEERELMNQLYDKLGSEK